jgi:hypothetical protein
LDAAAASQTRRAAAGRFGVSAGIIKAENAVRALLTPPPARVALASDASPLLKTPMSSPNKSPSTRSPLRRLPQQLQVQAEAEAAEVERAAAKSEQRRNVLADAARVRMMARLGFL